MRRRVGVSLRLLLIGSLLGSFCGIAAGAWSAVKQYEFSDYADDDSLLRNPLSVPTVVLAVFLAECGSLHHSMMRSAASSGLQRNRRVHPRSRSVDLRRYCQSSPAPRPALHSFTHPAGDSRFIAAISAIPCRWMPWEAISSALRQAKGLRRSLGADTPRAADSP